MSYSYITQFFINMKIRYWCKDCGEPMTKPNNGICYRCQNERIKERENRWKR